MPFLEAGGSRKDLHDRPFYDRTPAYRSHFDISHMKWDNFWKRGLQYVPFYACTPASSVLSRPPGRGRVPRHTKKGRRVGTPGASFFFATRA